MGHEVSRSGSVYFGVSQTMLRDNEVRIDMGVQGTAVRLSGSFTSQLAELARKSVSVRSLKRLSWPSFVLNSRRISWPLAWRSMWSTTSDDWPIEP
jgi:hypothetical protein